jgi:hypothetical protein
MKDIAISGSSSEVVAIRGRFTIEETVQKALLEL